MGHTVQQNAVPAPTPYAYPYPGYGAYSMPYSAYGPSPMARTPTYISPGSSVMPRAPPSPANPPPPRNSPRTPDKVRVDFAEALGRGLPDVYVPAQHNIQWSGLLSDLQARTHDMAMRGLRIACEGTYPLPDALNGTAQLFSSRRLVTRVPHEIGRLETQLAAPSITFV